MFSWKTMVGNERWNKCTDEDSDTTSKDVKTGWRPVLWDEKRTRKESRIEEGANLRKRRWSLIYDWSLDNHLKLQQTPPQKLFMTPFLTYRCWSAPAIPPYDWLQRSCNRPPAYLLHIPHPRSLQAWGLLSHTHTPHQVCLTTPVGVHH